MQKLRIELGEETNDELYDLLLLADPSKDIVDEYLERGECYTAWAGDELAGVYVLLKTRPQTVEIVNIAVKESLQKKGFGKQLVLDAIEKAKKLGRTRLKSERGIRAFISFPSIKNADSAFRRSTTISFSDIMMRTFLKTGFNAAIW